MSSRDEHGFRGLAEAGGATVVAFALRAKTLGVNEADLANQGRGATATLVIREEDVAGWLEIMRGASQRIVGPLRARPGDPIPSLEAVRAAAEESSCVPETANIEGALAELEALEGLVRSPEGRYRLRRLKQALQGKRAAAGRSSLAG